MPLTKKVIVSFPADLMHRLDEAVHQLQTKRSRFVREAVEEKLANIARLKLETELREGYQEMANSANH